MNNINKILNDFQNKFGIKPKKPKELEIISTGYKELDSALVIGGIPRGKIIEISGEPGSGKTLLSYKIIANAQKQRLSVIYVNTERNISKEYAKKMGVNLDTLLICNSITGEMTLETINYFIENKLIDLIVIDSLPALISAEEMIEFKGNYTLQKKMVSYLLKYFISKVNETNITLICLNQIRFDIKNFKNILPFDNLMSYYASIRIQLARIKSITKWRKIKGYIIEANIYKNNYGKLNIAEYNLML